MEPVDISAAARARFEAIGEGPTFEIQGTVYTFPAIGDMDWVTLQLLDSDLTRGLTELLDGQAEKFWDAHPSVTEVLILKDELLAAYAGAFSGESRASRASSKRTSKRSRPPSSATTAKA